MGNEVNAERVAVALFCGRRSHCPAHYEVHPSLSVRDAFGTGTGNYNLQATRLNNPVGCTALSFGPPPVGSSIGVAAATDCYIFSGSVGDRVRARAAETSGTLFAVLEMVRPDGTTLCGPTSLDQLTCQLDTAGSHTALVRDTFGTGTGDYELALTCIAVPCADTITTVFSDVPTDHFARPFIEGLKPTTNRGSCRQRFVASSNVPGQGSVFMALMVLVCVKTGDFSVTSW